MLQNAYQTTAGGIYRTDKILKAIEEEYTRGETIHANRLDGALPEDIHIFFVVDKSSPVPSFNHPVVIGDRIFLDGRPYINLDRNEGIYVVRSRMDFKLAWMRAAIEYVSIVEEGAEKDYRLIYNASSLPMQVFITWFAENITRRLGLDQEAQMLLSVVAGFYFYGIHTEEEEWTEHLRSKVATHISKVTRIPVQRVLELSEDFSYMDRLEGFVENAKRIVSSSRMEDMNTGFLITALAASAGWRGVQAKETVAIGLEHAPTWHALMVTAISERTASTSQLAKHIKRISKGGSDEAYVKALRSMFL